LDGVDLAEDRLDDRLAATVDMAAIYRWIDVDTYSNVPDRVRSDLRYALHGDWEDEIRGSFLFELERDGAITEVPRQLDRAPVRGQHMQINEQTWIIRSIAPFGAGSEYVASVRADWHPG
jgi:hypothetical protein